MGIGSRESSPLEGLFRLFEIVQGLKLMLEPLELKSQIFEAYEEIVSNLYFGIRDQILKEAKLGSDDLNYLQLTPQDLYIPPSLSS